MVNSPVRVVRAPRVHGHPTVSPDAALAWVAARVAARGRWLVTLDGRSGAGKTCLAQRIVNSYPGTQVLHLDDLYRDWDSLPSGVLRGRQLIEHWAAGRSPSYMPTQWPGMPAREREALHTQRPLVVEGVGADWVGRGVARGALWLEAERDERRVRALRRDGETFAPFWLAWEKQENDWFTQHPPRPHLVVDASGRTPTTSANASTSA